MEIRNLESYIKHQSIDILSNDLKTVLIQDP
jgi:hypothetical protein